MEIQSINCCVIIPTYNNERTLIRLLEGVLNYVPHEHIIVVNDGSTDSTASLLAPYSTQICILTNQQNSGKGNAIKRGIKKAIEKGYENVLTIDSDGQHFPSDIPNLIHAAAQHPGAVIMGSRNMEQEGIPQKSSFGNKFSNFWFKAETWISLPDTQTGFRIYPLKPLKKMHLFTNKFELEIEIIVRLAWKNVSFIPVPVAVKYDPEERVSHFRPGRDFFRISVLNSVLVLIALLYYYPKKFFSISTLHLIRDEAIKTNESNVKKALSLAFGIFMGIVPIWGFQLLVGIPLAVLFRLNKVLFILAANISVPPMIPFILYGSFATGQLIIDGQLDNRKLSTFSDEAITSNLVHYILGAFVLALIAGISVFLVSYILFRVFRKDPEHKQQTS